MVYGKLFRLLLCCCCCSIYCHVLFNKLRMISLPSIHLKHLMTLNQAKRKNCLSPRLDALLMSQGEGRQWMMMMRRANEEIQQAQKCLLLSYKRNKSIYCTHTYTYTHTQTHIIMFLYLFFIFLVMIHKNKMSKRRNDLFVFS